MPISKKKPVPEFRSDDDEREFWAAHDSTEFIDWRTAGRRKFPNLKPTLRTISLRLPVSMIEDLKAGTIHALVVQDPFRIGYEAVRTLVEKLRGGSPPKRIDLNARVVTGADLNLPEVHALLFPDLKRFRNDAK